MIVYEHPLNERVRTYLRLEYLFRRFEWLLHREHPIEHHFCFSTVFEIAEVAARADLKSDLLKDLERHKQQFLSYRGNPAVAAEYVRSRAVRRDLVPASRDAFAHHLAGSRGDCRYGGSVRPRGVDLSGGARR